MVPPTQSVAVFACLWLLASAAATLDASDPRRRVFEGDEEERLSHVEGPKRIAIVGGAMSGSFTAKYLAERDASCQLSSITVFEAVPIQSPIVVGGGGTGGGGRDGASSLDDDDDDGSRQGTRVQTVRVSTSSPSSGNENGALVEVGASIGYKEFHLILDHVRADPDVLKLVPPFSTGTAETDDDDKSTFLPLYQGLGIYDGPAADDDESSDPSKRHAWSLNTAPIFSCEWIPASWREIASKVALVWRYGWELRKLSVVTHHVSQKFADIPELLGDHDPDHDFESPMELWRHLELDKLVETTFDDVLEAMRVPLDVPAWRTYLGQGSVRREFLEAMNLVNYNQDNRGVNALVGFGSFAAAFGGLFAIEGGNVQLISSAFRQANRHRHRHCGTSPASSSSSSSADVQQVHQRVTTVIATTAAGDEALSETQFELFAANQSLGVFDIVVVAAPLQQANIQFYVQSAFDGSVLQPMPLGRRGVVDPERGLGLGPAAAPGADDEPHQGHPPFPPDLDPASARPYTQVVTTLVSNATLALLPAQARPRSIMMTARGKANLHNITAISQLQHRRVDGGGSGEDDASASLYKVFSDDKLSREALTELFGSHHVVEHVKVWPRPYGGATPDYQGGTTSEGFVLYDANPSSAAHRGGRGGGAIYYPVAMEQSTLACMELAAIGAKATAKLIARRLGFVAPAETSDRNSRDEL